MRSIVVTQNEVQLGDVNETFLFSAIAGLERHCDSLHSCQVLLEGGDQTPERRKPFSITLLLRAGDHSIAVKADDWTHNELTARDAICTAIRRAEDELRDLKSTHTCTSCCSQ
jgi:hypothetical protein